MNKPLEKCPFCGGQAELIKTANAWYIQCRKCSAMMGRGCWTVTAHRTLSFDTEEDVVKAWNERAENG